MKSLNPAHAGIMKFTKGNYAYRDSGGLAALLVLSYG
jgi:hypothetical protein